MIRRAEVLKGVGERIESIAVADEEVVGRREGLIEGGGEIGAADTADDAGDVFDLVDGKVEKFGRRDRTGRNEIIFGHIFVLISLRDCVEFDIFNFRLRLIIS